MPLRHEDTKVHERNYSFALVYVIIKMTFVNLRFLEPLWDEIVNKKT